MGHFYELPEGSTWTHRPRNCIDSYHIDIPETAKGVLTRFMQTDSFKATLKFYYGDLTEMGVCAYALKRDIAIYAYFLYLDASTSTNFDESYLQQLMPKIEARMREHSGYNHWYPQEQQDSEYNSDDSECNSDDSECNSDDSATTIQYP